jgi:hypothetical protein
MRGTTLNFSAALMIALGAITGASLLVSTPAAYAQTTSGDIVGTVKDPTGAAVPGAKVTVKNEATGVANATVANSAGQYRVSNLLPGTYDITSNASGFQPTTIKSIIIDLNKTATADVTLGLSANTTTVEVEANAGIVLDTTTQNLTTTFDNTQLSQMPNTSVGEGVLNSSLLAPGVGSTGGIGIGVGPSIAGQRPRNNNFEIEGIDNNNKVVTGPLVYVPNDAVENFSLITTQFSPEFGHSAGGQFNTNIVTGTNQFHGRIYEYFQNRNLNAAGGVAGGKTPNPRYDNNRYGGQLGGPVIKDKLFFFANYERQSVGESEQYFLCTPTAAGLAAIAGASAGLNATNVAQYLKYIPAANYYGGAQVTSANDLACGNQASGAQYFTVYTPAEQANIQAGNAPGGAGTNVPLGNYLVSAPQFSNFNVLTTGADWTISNKDSFRLRYIYNRLGSEDTGAYLPVFFQTIPNRNQFIALSEYHTFTPNLTNELRIGYNRLYNTTPSGPFVYPGTSEFPNLTFFDEGGINVGPDGNAPQSTVQNLYQLTDNVSYTKGKHTIKVGFDGRKYISPQVFVQRERGDYEWSDTSSSLYDATSQFFNDYAPNSAGFAERSAGNAPYYGDQTALYGYGNDTFRATQKLTLNLGLRYEFTSVPVGERSQSLNSIASVPGFLSFGAPQPAYTNFAPRFGIEYAPDEKTSIRLGYGIAYDVLFDNLGTLAAPPEHEVTNDVGTGIICAAGAAPTGNCVPNFGTPMFLAHGGLIPQITPYTTQKAAANVTGAYIPNQVLPYSENYTFTIQRTLGYGLTAELGYVGNRGIHLPTQNQINVQPRVNATNNLPTTAGGVTIEAAGSAATTLAAISAANSNIITAYSTNNFISKITSYEPYSGSSYNGLIANLQGRMKNGLQLNMSYTYSKTMDDATAEVFATVLTPRRAQNSQNVNADYSRSALDRTNRLTLEADYDFQAFKGSNWFMRNLVANWVFSPIYTYESPEYVTVLSGDNANLNGDSGAAIDRTIINPTGNKNLGSPVTAVKNGAGATIGYTANNPAAYYIQAGAGTLPNASRNTLPLPVENNLDFAASKRFTVFTRYSLEFGAQGFNVLNHAQYIPGSVDDVGSRGYTGSYNLQTASSSLFNKPQLEFQNNPRSVQLSGKFIF